MEILNGRCYKDPTAAEAIGNVTREMKRKKKIVFICSPYAGDIQGNTIRARRYGRFAVTEGAVPIIPHLMFPQFLDDTNSDERELGINMGLVLMTKCHEVWVFGNKISSGMETEIKRAKNYDMVIRYFTSECKEKRGGSK